MNATVLRYSRPYRFKMNVSVIQVMTPASTSTKTTAIAIPTAVSIFLEVPRKGQLPRYWANRILLMRMHDMARTM